MQRVRLERELAARRRRERQLLVAVVEQLFARFDGAARHERPPHFGARAVGREHDVGFEPSPSSIVRFDERRTVAVDADALLAEAVLDAVAPRRELVEQGVERRARHGVDLFGGALAVRQETLLPREVVHHAAAHRDQELRDVVVEARAAQRRDAARREREVDRAAALRARREGLAALDDDGLEAPAREQDGEQAARGSAADDGDALTRRAAHASSVRRSACTAP